MFIMKRKYKSSILPQSTRITNNKRGTSNEVEVEQQRQRAKKQKVFFDSQDPLIADPIETFSQDDIFTRQNSKRSASNQFELQQQRQRPKKQKTSLDSQDSLTADPIETFSSQDSNSSITQEYNQPVPRFTTVEGEVEELSFEHESSFEYDNLLNSSLDDLQPPTIPSDEEDDAFDVPFLFDTVQNEPVPKDTETSELSSIEGFTTDEEQEEVIISDVESFGDEESKNEEEQKYIPPPPPFEFILESNNLIQTVPGIRTPPKFLKGGLAESAFNVIKNEKEEFSRWNDKIRAQMARCGSVVKVNDSVGEFYLFRMLDVWEEKGMIYSWCVPLDDNEVDDMIKPSPQSTQVTTRYDSVEEFSSQPIINSLPPYEEKEDDLKILFAFSFTYINGKISVERFKKDQPIAIWTPYTPIDVDLEGHGEIEVNVVTRFMADAFY